MQFSPNTLEDVSLNHPFLEPFQTKYFEEIFNAIQIQKNLRSKLKLSSADPDLLTELTSKIRSLTEIPSILEKVISENILSLAIKYQVFWAEKLYQGIVTQESPYSYVTSLELFSGKKATGTNKKELDLIQKHVRGIKDNFFSDVKESELLIGSFNLDSPVTLGYFFRNINYHFTGSFVFQELLNVEIKNLVNQDYTLNNETIRLKFDMFNHPFVFAVNCAYLHHRMFVLSLNTSSDFSFILKKSSVQHLGDRYPAALSIIKGEDTIENYVSSFVKNYSKTSQRKDDNLSQILFGIHMESIRQVRENIYAAWRQYCADRMNVQIQEVISRNQEHWKKMASESSSVSFGWS